MWTRNVRPEAEIIKQWYCKHNVHDTVEMATGASAINYYQTSVYKFHIAEVADTHVKCTAQ